MWKLQSQTSKLYISLRPELYNLIKSIKTQRQKKRDEEERDMEET